MVISTMLHYVYRRQSRRDLRLRWGRHDPDAHALNVGAEGRARAAANRPCIAAAGWRRPAIHAHGQPPCSNPALTVACASSGDSAARTACRAKLRSAVRALSVLSRFPPTRSNSLILLGLSNMLPICNTKLWPSQAGFPCLMPLILHSLLL